MAHVCYVFQGEYPWDVRVEKITTSLADHGFYAHVVANNRRGLKSAEQLADGIVVHRLPRWPGRYVRYALNLPAFVSPVWLTAVSSVVIKHHCRLIIVRDLPLAPTAIVVGRLLSVPVLIDLAENYPAMIRDGWRYRGPTLSDVVLRNPTLLRGLERWAIGRVDGLMVVCEQSRRRVARLLNGRPMPLWVVGNTPRRDPSQATAPHALVERMRSHQGLTLLYTGRLEEFRGVETVIASIPSIQRSGINPLFVIVGKGTAEETLQVLAHRLGVLDNVVFGGWVEHVVIPSIIEAADVCIVPHHVTENTNTTLPNKLFDYMAQGKPVITTNAVSLIDVVETLQCGRIYHDGNTEELTLAIVELNDPSVRAALGEAGRLAVQRCLNWETDERTLLQAVRFLVNQANPTGVPQAEERAAGTHR
jgi:glycosyltransferase involved in cell wall biosynthesis